MEHEQTVPIADDSDIVHARQLARQAAAELGFSLMDQSRCATAVSELTRNVLRYATGSRGTATIRVIEGGGATVGLEVIVADDGPGISDLARAMQPGFSTGNGLGLGLAGTKRLMDEMTIATGPGSGTVVTIRKWKP